MRRFVPEDMFRFNNVNLDKLTETYHNGFYLDYLAKFPDIFYVAETNTGKLMGYVMGKVEGKGENWHGHVTAITVAPEFRRLGLGRTLMKLLEDVSENVYNAYFVDLFVRASNDVAIAMYKRFGYSVYRRVIKYYSSGPEEDAFDMRRALARDSACKSTVPLGHSVQPHELMEDDE